MSPQITNQNGQQRKTLAAQIDRLDSMLDNLAEGINGTVVDAVKEAIEQAVREAVHTAVKEVLTNPVLQQRLRSEPVREPAAPRGGVVHGVRRACRWLANLAKGAYRGTCAAVRWSGRTTKEVARKSVLAVQDCGRRVCRRVQALARGIWLRSFGFYRLSRRVCAVAVVALGVAMVLATVAITVGPFLASLLSGFVTHVLVLAALVQRQVWGSSDTGSRNVAA